MLYPAMASAMGEIGRIFSDADIGPKIAQIFNVYIS